MEWKTDSQNDVGWLRKDGCRMDSGVVVVVESVSTVMMRHRQSGLLTG